MMASAALRRVGGPHARAMARGPHQLVHPFSTLTSNSARIDNHHHHHMSSPEAADSTPSAPINNEKRKTTALDFDSPRSAHGTKTMAELLRAILVYTSCQIQPVVDNAGSLINMSRMVVGNTLTDAVLGQTFYKHFCAGKDTDSIRPKIEQLRNDGNVGAILDYAAENEGEECTADNGKAIVTQPPYSQPARIYEYKSESDCDHHVDTFLSCIRSVRDTTPDGFAAMKLTALGQPQLLERLSTAILESQKLFFQCDANSDGKVSHEEFASTYEQLFTDAEEKLPELLTRLDPFHTGEIDYIEWSRLLRPEDLPRITSTCKDIGPLAMATPSEEELQLYNKMHARLRKLADEAADCGVRLLVDAEQHKFQPAIDSLVLDLQQEYNALDRTDTPTIFQTYQCYKKETMGKIKVDLERSRRFGYHFACKLVRGAYMQHERERAKEMDYPDPIHETIEDTHNMYDEAVEYLLKNYAKENGKIEVMIASHNQQSIEKAIQLTEKYGIDGPVLSFAQLLGMSDNLTNTLGSNGYRAYKYTPYGEVHEVIPYLLRRAQENSGMLKNGGSSELVLLLRELKRRLTPSSLERGSA